MWKPQFTIEAVCGYVSFIPILKQRTQFAIDGHSALFSQLRGSFSILKFICFTELFECSKMFADIRYHKSCIEYCQVPQICIDLPE